MAKYRVLFKANAFCVREIEIQNEANPYTEADNLELKQNYFCIDVSSASITDLKPID